MSVRREVLSLSQLLRRNENSRKSHRTGRAPPLPLQTSRHRAERTLPAKERHSGIKHARSEPFTERPARSVYAPMSCTQRDRVSTSQPEIDTTNEATNSFTALLQDAYDGESQQSAVTSMSQSSFSQTQSINLLSQDDQRWQVQQVPPQSPSTSAHCHSTDKLRELELNLTRSFHEQTHKQEQQQHELMMRLVSPVKRSVEGIKAKLVTSGEAQQQLGAAIEKLTQKVDGLRQQSLNNNSAGQETHKVVASEAAAVKAALRRLQEKVETVEGGVKSCSSLILKAHQSEAAKQDTLLAAVAASSCKCVEDSLRAGDFPDTDRTTRKRQRRSSHDNAGDGEQASCNFSSPVQMPTTRTRTQSSPHYAAGFTVSYGSDDDDIAGRSLNVSLKRIQSLLEKRREYLHDH